MISFGIVSKNRKANFNYNITETFEAGIVLRGVEVKSLRSGTANISEAFVVERNGELWLQNSYIPEYQGGVLSRFDTRAQRKLLLHKKQVKRLIGEITKSGISLVPLDIHFNEKGKAKVTLGLGTGKKNYDKRQDVANRDWQREKSRILKNKQYD
jgi:SsrA-binding protein